MVGEERPCGIQPGLRAAGGAFGSAGEHAGPQQVELPSPRRRGAKPLPLRAGEPGMHSCVHCLVLVVDPHYDMGLFCALCTLLPLNFLQCNYFPPVTQVKFLLPYLVFFNGKQC